MAIMVQMEVNLKKEIYIYKFEMVIMAPMEANMKKEIHIYKF
jgi:hypothetical protein